MEEQEQQTSTTTTTQVETVTETETQPQTKVGIESLTDLPDIEEFLKSEKEVKSAPELKGLKKVESNALNQDKEFTLKKDEKKTFIKKRIKVFTGVYIAVVSLLFAFVLGNAITMAVLNHDIKGNKETIQTEAAKVEVWEGNYNNNLKPSSGDIEVSLNVPRDYSDDTAELTFFDKLSILFRNLFG